MREIKFRAWDSENKYFVDPVFYFIEFDGSAWFNLGGATEGKDNLIDQSDKLKVMQYTGLKDKNGVEIYEGDILKDDSSSVLEVKFGELPLDKSGDCVCTFQSFYVKDYGSLGYAPCYECRNIGEWMEIIGNIHENPELINTKPTQTGSQKKENEDGG